MENITVLYRANVPWYQEGTLDIMYDQYNVIKRTPKGVWVYLPSRNPEKKFVLLSGKKRFAYPTKEEAFTNLFKRTERRLKYLRRDLEETQNVFNKLINDSFQEYTEINYEMPI